MYINGLHMYMYPWPCEGDDTIIIISRLGKNDEKKVISFYQLIDEKKVIAASDAKMASESLKEANQAQKSADAAELKVRQAKKELDAILDIIATVEEPEPGILDDLERRLGKKINSF